MAKRLRFSKISREEIRDLGLGSKVLQQSRDRFLNRDGSFNISRSGLSFLRSLSLYHTVLTISWVRFQLFVVGFYFGTNLVFAVAYLLSGPGALHGTSGVTLGERFIESFFFSVHTLATIGYGTISPASTTANILVTVEALVGLLGLTLITSLLFARFSRPDAKILFSNNAIIAPYRGITAFEFRIINERSNQLIDLHATVVLSRRELEHGKEVRRLHPLTLERDQVMFFPAHWVLVHPIEESSPLFGITKEELEKSGAEFLILLTGFDETFSQTVHARSSYKHSEVVWGARFSNMFDETNHQLGVDIRKLHDIEMVSD
jgi:inward rectifier potassium channel